jgi:drug/metabolite transporter (DMT)-like permease
VSLHTVSLFTSVRGELAALTAAFLWAVAAVFYRRAGERIPARELNLIKGVLAIALLLLTLGLSGGLKVPALPRRAWGLLLISGALGIGLGDTAYFEALKALGTRRALLLGILSPPLSAVIARVFLNERLDVTAWLGIALTVGGVAWVVSERTPEVKAEAHVDLGRGLLFGLAAALMQSVGAILSRMALTETTVSPLWSAVIRLLAGFVVLVIWIALARRQVGTWRGSGGARELWATVVFAIFTGTYLAVWLQQISFKFANVGTAQTLLATSQLFILPIAALQGERISQRAILGAVVALSGVALLFTT